MKSMASEDSNSQATENIALFALGALIGVSAAILLAPERGVHTRRRIAGQVKAGRDTLLDSSQDVINRGRELFERGREIAQEAAEMFERGRRMAETGFDEQVESEHVPERGL
jgi:gas vesicle protein